MSLLNGLGAGLAAFGATGLKDEEDQQRARPLLNSTPAAASVPAVGIAATPPATATAQPASEELPPKLAEVVTAIYGQESGSGANTSTSVTGARGGMQIQPATFKQYAKPGESIDNPEHNLAVGQRIIADLWQKSGGDPARVAVGYFSGPGNIAPPDSPTPWVRNASDPNGKTVASYVNDILKRLGAS